MIFVFKMMWSKTKQKFSIDKKKFILIKKKNKTYQKLWISTSEQENKNYFNFIIL